MLTKDKFLNGALEISQPSDGYRAGTDPVFLAAAVPANLGERVLEIGCGVGVASLCLAKRIKGLSITCIEVQEELAEIARMNAQANNIEMEVYTARLESLPKSVKDISYDHVFMNPPYYLPDGGSRSENDSRDLARREQTRFGQWIEVANSRLRQGGVLTMIQLTSRMAEVIGYLSKSFGDIEIKPLASRHGRVSKRIVVRAKKSRKGDLQLYEPLILHEGVDHRDGNNYSALANSILRHGECLLF